MRPEWSRLVAAVACGATIIGLVAACGIPTDRSPQAISPNNVPFHLLDPTSPSASTTTLPPAVAVAETVYLVNTSQQVTPVSRDVAPPASLTEILGALLDGPTQAESSSGLQSFLVGKPSQVTATQFNGVATVNFSASPFQLVADQILAVAQIVFTATAQPGITGVTFEIGGQRVEVPTAAGVQVAGPVGRSDYTPQGQSGPGPAGSPSPATSAG